MKDPELSSCEFQGLQLFSVILKVAIKSHSVLKATGESGLEWETKE